MELIVWEKNLKHKEKAKPKEYPASDFCLLGYEIDSVFMRLNFLKVAPSGWTNSNGVENFLIENNITSIKVGFSWKINRVRNTQPELTLISFEFIDKETASLFILEHM